MTDPQGNLPAAPFAVPFGGLLQVLDQLRDDQAVEWNFSCANANRASGGAAGTKGSCLAAISTVRPGELREAPVHVREWNQDRR